MNFLADKQTLDDLNLLGKFNPQSVFSIFNRTKTRGGERLLEKMFREPLADVQEINKRSLLFAYFGGIKLKMNFQQASFQGVENYLTAGTSDNWLSMAGGIITKKILGTVALDDRYALLQAELSTTIQAIAHLKELLAQLPNIALAARSQTILSDERLRHLLAETVGRFLPLRKVIQYHWLLNHTLCDQMSELLKCIYHMDVFVSVSYVAAERGFTYAEALPGDARIIEASAIRHPGLQNGVANALKLDGAAQMLFLTGANMAGKSTFMKSFGIAVYLAHMGFPLAAGKMRFSVLDGLYSSINVPDNIQLGYSHFYAEVLRVKQAASAIASGKNMVVIFDELFKGTNVKDAYDATLAVTESMARYHNCFFIVSTHIIEVGEALKKSANNVRFAFLPTTLEAGVPKYSYQLKEGITSDRQGMIIIENEGILELLNSGN
ncbi:MutS-related protein [Pedobacter psychroterrae]|uniref:DNA mismatch repair protein n=1 Tax=Pedobacter psychroterrae TaxID=2530453 RepID=A0A4V2MLA2_9SPHI|nr:DNA mismatch repair protein [Pedobacter psychroterrae]TCD01247.1 DNA mismatch repair protein [Pedobacter psychroterrae]